MLRLNSSVIERSIIDGCRKGHQQSQKALYDRYAGKMTGVCRRYIADYSEAEHVMVGAMVKVFEKIEQFNEEGSFEGWIRRIMVNESLMYLRKHKAMSVMEDVTEEAVTLDYDHLDAHLHASDLMAMVEELPVGYRTIFNLYAIEGYKHDEISNMLGISAGTSKSQLNRARSLLKKRLAQLDLEEDKPQYYGK